MTNFITQPCRQLLRRSLLDADPYAVNGVVVR